MKLLLSKYGTHTLIDMSNFAYSEQTQHPYFIFSVYDRPIPSLICKNKTWELQFILPSSSSLQLPGTSYPSPVDFYLLSIPGTTAFISFPFEQPCWVCCSLVNTLVVSFVIILPAPRMVSLSSDCLTSVPKTLLRNLIFSSRVDKLFCKGPDSNYFLLCGPSVAPTTPSQP